MRASCAKSSATTKTRRALWVELPAELADALDAKL
jgi:hypothetical protein